MVGVKMGPAEVTDEAPVEANDPQKQEEDVVFAGSLGCKAAEAHD